MKRLLSLLGLSFFVLGTISLAVFAQLSEKTTTPEEYEAYQKMLLTNYLQREERLCGLLLDTEDVGKVTKITLSGFNENVFKASNGQDVLSASTEDPAGLGTVQRACSLAGLLRPFPGPIGMGMGVGGPYILGELQIHTENRIITIQITDFGFLLGKEEKEWHLQQSCFYSWALAKILDDMVAHARRDSRHISHKLFAALAGEHVIEINKQIYWESQQAEMQRGHSGAEVSQ